MKNFYKLSGIVFLLFLLSMNNLLYSQPIIGDRVWEDSNENGIQDPGEPPVIYATVKLFKESGAIVYVTNTDINGHYAFPDIPDGNYYIQFSTEDTYQAYKITTSTGILTDPDNSDITGYNGDGTTSTFSVTGTNIDYIDAGFIKLNCEPDNDKACADLSFFDLSDGGTLDDEQTNVCSFSYLYFDDCEPDDQSNAVFYTFTIENPNTGIKINITPTGNTPIQGTIVATISNVDDDFCHNDVSSSPSYCELADEAEFIWNCLDEGTYQLRISTSDDNAGTFDIASTFLNMENNPCAINNKCKNAEELIITENCLWNDFENKCNNGACPDKKIIEHCNLNAGPTVWYKFRIPQRATALDIKVDNAIHSNFDIVVFDQASACTKNNGWCGEGGVLDYPIDVKNEDGKYYYLAIVNTDNKFVKFDIHIRFNTSPINDSPCINDENPPLDLELDKTIDGTTCCAIGFNDDEEKDFANTKCDDKSDDNTVWYRAKVDTMFSALQIDISDVYYSGFFSVEVYSGSEDAICENNANYIKSKCNEFPETSIIINLDCVSNDYLFIKVSSSDSETECADFKIAIEQIKEVNADNCRLISDLETLSPETPEEAEIIKDCICSTIKGASPNQGLSGGCSDFGSNPTVWFQINIDKNATQLYSYVTTEGSWTPVWSVFYSPTGNCNDISIVYNPPGSSCSSTFFPQAPPLITGCEQGTYFIAVSSMNGDTIDNPNFDICIATIGDISSCTNNKIGCQPNPSLIFEVRDREFKYLEPNGSPYYGPFYPGEKVKIHVNFIFDGTVKGDDWLMGVFPKLGNGWNTESFDFNKYPAVSSVADQAKWYSNEDSCGVFATEDLKTLCTYTDDNGVLQFCNQLCEDCPCSGGIKSGDALPGGYCWVREGASPKCDANKCSPSYKYGTGAPTDTINWDFELYVKSFDSEEECNKNNDLSISFLALSDGVVGCWDDPLSECLINYTHFSPYWEAKWSKDDTIQIQTSKEDNKCYGDCNGRITIDKVLNMNEPIKYKWNTGDTTKSLINLCNGTYFVTIEDAQQNTKSIIFNIISPEKINSNINSNDQSASGINDGITSLNPSGGIPPYLVNWSTGDTTYQISELHPGTYIVTITDSQGCTKIDSAIIQKYECASIKISKNITNAGCFGDCDGHIEIVDIENAALPIQYKWNTGDTTSTLSNLCKGQYIVLITDAKNCQFSDTFNINEPNEISIAVDLVRNINEAFSGGIFISANDTINYTYSWTGPCNFNSNLKDIDSLNCEGCYNLTVTDTVSNCQRDTSICIKTTATSEAKYSKKLLKIYPNPAEDYFIIDFSNTEVQDAQIMIYNISGKKIYNGLKQSDNLQTKINTKTINTGVYIIEIKLKKKVYYEKLIIAK